MSNEIYLVMGANMLKNTCTEKFLPIELLKATETIKKNCKNIK